MRLAVDVSGRTLRQDLTAKKMQYGSAGIPEYWVVNINARILRVFRQPMESGYALESVLTPGAIVSPLAAPVSVIAVADLLP